jgi:formate C-acetyltransferase
LRGRAIKREYRQYRDAEKTERAQKHIAGKFYGTDTGELERMTYRFEYLAGLEGEAPVILDDEKFVLVRTVAKIPDIYSPAERKQKESAYYLHDKGYVNNIAADYSDIIEKGAAHKLKQIEAARIKINDTGRSEYAACLVRCICAIEKLAAGYRQKAQELGREDIAGLFARIPSEGAQTFKEALQFFRLLHFSVWLAGSHHNVVGRFDQFMYKYYKNDIDSGRITKGEALELLEEFFITFSKDAELYPGVQQGDNGQSLVLGGYINNINITENGGGSDPKLKLKPEDLKDLKDGYNELSDLCMQASLNVRLIDPKINLRVNKLTPLGTYIKASQLTKQGLGFPQYSNDDTVIDGLAQLGYDYADAVNYVVAACWEFIIPGRAMDIVNIGALSYVRSVNKCVSEKLRDCDSFDEFLAGVKENIREQARAEISRFKNIYIIPSPVMTLLFDGNINSLTDISEGSEYNNFGLHGTGLANAADSVCAVKKHVFDLKSITKQELTEAIENNFEGGRGEDIKALLKYNSPKMGMDDDEADNIASELIGAFSSELALHKNERGGIFRGGTGSAMFYLWHAKNEGASADGRKKGEPLSANFSPSLDAGCKSPLSVIKSFTKPDVKKVINGGPLTLELHDTVFRNEDGVEKTAMLVRGFIQRGGHQLQINAVNRDVLIKAKKSPDEYRNLIVRVWGWSGYFVELDEEYQDHIIRRAEYE